MIVGDYVAKGREGFNSGVRAIGNKIYSGLGDKLIEDIDVRGVARVGLTGLVISGGVVNSGGCDAVVGGYVGHKLAGSGESRQGVDPYSDGKLVIRYWNDDGDLEIEEEEMLNDIGESVNMSNMGIMFYIDALPLEKSVTFNLLDSENNIILEKYYPAGGGGYGKGALPEGEYMMVGRFKNYYGKNAVFSRKFIVTR